MSMKDYQIIIFACSEGYQGRVSRPVKVSLAVRRVCECECEEDEVEWVGEGGGGEAKDSGSGVGSTINTIMVNHLLKCSQLSPL